MEDKNIKELLKWAVEETSENFTAQTMRRIETLSKKTTDQALVPSSVKQIFVLVFVSVLLAIIALSVFITPSDLPFDLDITIPSITMESFSNIVYYIIIFWILMLLNHFLDSKNNTNYTG